MNKDRRRSSIHDITSVSNGDIAEAQGPITGQGNSKSAETCKASEQPSSTSSAPEIGIYVATIKQPVGGPLMPAVGTPVAGSPIVYGVQQPTVPRIVVASAPFHLVPMAAPMPNAPSQR